MKKIFTLLAAMAATTMAWAETPVLLFEGNPAQEGVTYETGYELEDLGFIQMYTQDAHISFKAKTGTTVTIQVLSSEDIGFCSGSNCSNGTDQTKNIVVGADPSSAIAVDGEYTTEKLIIDKVTDGFPDEPAVLHNIDVTVRANYSTTPLEVVEVKVRLTDKPQSEVGGVTDVTVNTGNVTLRGNTLDYNFNQPTKLEIYNVNGSLVMSRKVYSCGSVSLDTLHPGLYIYSAGALTGKILVRK